MRVLIAGGTGLIGARLCQCLKKDQHEVIVLSRDPQSRSERIPNGVQIIRWDGRTATGWGNLIDSHTALINLAGEHPVSWLWNPDQYDAILNSRMDAALAMAAAIEGAPEPPRLLLQASTVDYYGDCEDDMVVEDSPPGPGWRAQLTAEWEQTTAAIPVRQCWLRFGLVLDRKRDVLPDVLTCDQQWISWVHNDDVARAIRFLLTYDEADGPVNITAPRPVTAACFRRTLVAVHGRPVAPVLTDTVLESQRVLPQRLLSWGFRFALPDAEDALRVLNL